MRNQEPQRLRSEYKWKMENPMMNDATRGPGDKKKVLMKLILPGGTLMNIVPNDTPVPQSSWATVHRRGVTFAAMARSVRPGTPLRFSLNKRPPEHMADLLDRVEKYLWAEEDSMTTTQDEGISGQKRRDRPEGKIPEEPKRSRMTLSKHFTPLTTSREHILNQIKGQDILKWSKPMRMPADRSKAQLYCQFHKDHGHTTDECKVLPREIDNLIARGHLKQFVKTERQGAKRPKAPATISFDDTDLEEVLTPHDDALVISLQIDAYVIKRILVDTGSSANILFEEAFSQMKISRERIHPVSSPLYGFTGASAPVEGVIPLTVVAGSYPLQATQSIDFLVVKIKSAYNGILGRAGLNKLQAIASTFHMCMKFPTLNGIGVAKGDQAIARKCYMASCKVEEALAIEDQRDEHTFRRPEPLAPIALTTLNSPIPFAMWGMDILGPFPPASTQQKFVIVAIDYFTKWVEAKALSSITEQKCEDFLWRSVVCRFGIPRVLVTDNERQFDNYTFRVFCANLSIEQRFTSVAHPQTNGQTEVTNRTLLQGLKKKLDGVKGLWVDELHKILWAYRTTTRNSTGETPFNLAFGTEALIPVEIGLPSFRLLTYDPNMNDEALRCNLDLLDEQRDQAQLRLTAYQQRVARYHDRRIRPLTFRIGDLVFHRVAASNPRDAIGKLSPNWEGPYRVTKYGGPGSYHLEHLDGKKHPTNVECYQFMAIIRMSKIKEGPPRTSYLHLIF
ncbi:hypothetical protein RJ639_015910 [Escallonia herrerae]|uniref:Integrase catalytic domain-containing protein n=1 Tax=Escallonia herrerae TaxID=1293975 RepID=A0AA88VD87_9ASTE|nr:hypothetical protein RJ639_015910 [Escallonia herrerae]